MAIDPSVEVLTLALAYDVDAEETESAAWDAPISSCAGAGNEVVSPAQAASDATTESEREKRRIERRDECIAVLEAHLPPGRALRDHRSIWDASVLCDARFQFVLRLPFHRGSSGSRIARNAADPDRRPAAPLTMPFAWDSDGKMHLWITLKNPFGLFPGF